MNEKYEYTGVHIKGINPDENREGTIVLADIMEKMNIELQQRHVISEIEIRYLTKGIKETNDFAGDVFFSSTYDERTHVMIQTDFDYNCKAPSHYSEPPKYLTPTTIDFNMREEPHMLLELLNQNTGRIFKTVSEAQLNFQSEFTLFKEQILKLLFDEYHMPIGLPDDAMEISTKAVNNLLVEAELPYQLIYTREGKGMLIHNPVRRS